MTESVNEVPVAALITKLEGTTKSDVAPTADWMVRVLMAGAKFPGFWSGEIIPPEDLSHHDWKLVQRFSTEDEAKSWQQSEARQKLISDFSAVPTSAGCKVSDEIANYDSTFGNVATAIVTDVKPGMEDAYFEWEVKIQSAQAKFPGYRGSYLQPPPPGRKGQWSTLLRFDKPDSLQKWFASDVRLAFLADANKIIEATHFQSMSNSFPGWFPVDKTTGEGPPNWKTSMLVLLGLFPVVMLEIAFLSPHMKWMNPAVGSFLNLVLSVVLTTWGTMPIFIKAFTWWLFPPKENPRETNIKGTIAMIALFLGEIAALWTLLLPKT